MQIVVYADVIISVFLYFCISMLAVFAIWTRNREKYMKIANWIFIKAAATIFSQYHLHTLTQVRRQCLHDCSAETMSFTRISSSNQGNGSFCRTLKRSNEKIQSNQEFYLR